MICIVKIPSELELVEGLQKLIRCQFLCQERMKLIIVQINPCDLVLKKTLQNVLRSLGSNPIILRKFRHTVSLLTFRSCLLFEKNLLQVAECAGIVIDVTCCMKYCNTTNIHTYAAVAFRYGSLVDRNLPDHFPLWGKICRATLLNQHDLNLYPDGISVV
jgi:hypothetical protein